MSWIRKVRLVTACVNVMVTVTVSSSVSCSSISTSM